jgi:hypothetical protein
VTGPIAMDTWLCPACLAKSVAGYETCTACSAPLVLGGRFVVLEPLASHGSAHTLGGIDRESGAPVILKTLRMAGMADWKQLELFQRGISVLRGLSHPGIPRHIGDGDFARGGETIYYWAQERVPGRTLAEGLAQGQRWTEARAQALADALLEILEYLQAFSPPILHRDIKPSNVMERPGDGGFALIDFDLVKDTLDPEGGETTALGTAGYAPLEQLMGRSVPASDVYGLGATLVALLSRKSPADLLDEDASRLELRPHIRVSGAFAGFLEQLVEPRVSRRPADARAARALLRAAIAAGELGASASGMRDLARTSEASDRLALAGTVMDDAASAPQRLARARAELLRVLRRRAATQRTALALVDRKPAPIVPTGPSSNGVVVVETTLAELHPAPWWVLPVRAAILAGAAPLLAAKGFVLGVLLLAVWVASGFVVRYRVELPPGRALFKGGIWNTGVPGTYRLRRRWTERAHSIPTVPLHLDWRPAPTRLDQPDRGERQVWLELDLELWVEPSKNDLGQFQALFTYLRWHQHRWVATRQLRERLVHALVEHVGATGLLAHVDGSPVRLDDDEDVQLAIELGLEALGLELRVWRPRRIALCPRTDDLETQDRLWIDARPPPPS